MDRPALERINWPFSEAKYFEWDGKVYEADGILPTDNPWLWVKRMDSGAAEFLDLHDVINSAVFFGSAEAAKGTEQ